MDDVTDAIKSGYNLYKENYNRVLSAFIALFVFIFLVSILSMGLNFAFNLVERPCEFTPSGADFLSSLVSLMVCEYTKPSFFVRTALGWLSSIVVILITLSVIKPLEETASKKNVSEWTSHLGTQFSNAVKLFFFELFVGIITILPILLFFLLWVPGTASVLSSASEEQLRVFMDNIMQGLLVFVVGVFIVVLIETVLVLLFTFVRIELVLSNRGLMDAVRNSVEIVKNNAGKVFVFHLIWLLISLVLAVLAFFTCCLAFIVGPAISYLLILPVRLFSEILLWRSLVSPKQITVKPESVESSRIVY
ncbi:MAG: hypothetical protein JW778_02195 [Candidatus Altiarchaeota archaeon]|nr:hypothetical protein [Candidatus Altiarchaeota archaeon]